MKFLLKQSEEELTTYSGMALVGALLAKTNLYKRLKQTKLSGVIAPDLSHGDIAFSYIGLLCQGKNDFDAIEEFRKDQFFRKALHVYRSPSSPTLRQRLDVGATHPDWMNIIAEESISLLKIVKAPLTPIDIARENDEGNQEKHCYIPIDCDVSPFDNSKTKKEGVSRTYKSFDGYAPMFAYIGVEGYALHSELRAGSDHCQKGTPEFLQKALSYAKQLTNDRTLVRMDSGNDSGDNLALFLKEETKTDFIVKRNPRREGCERWIQLVKTEGICENPRLGKNVYWGSTSLTKKGIDQPIRVVYCVTERTILKTGQVLLIPEVEVESYWTSLPDSPKTIANLYHQHGTSEQFHSEIKTDIGLERFPSGKFATNALILQLTMLAYNILRIIGQHLAEQVTSPLKKKAFRRRIKTVIQTMITFASRLVYHARRYYLHFGNDNPWFATFQAIYTTLT